MHPITIIGTGLAGYTVAREFRKLDKDSPLRLITNDDGNFYSKPMLSNAFAQNKTPENLVAIPVAKMIEQLNAEILTNTQVSQINPLTIQNKQLEYSKLVLSIGAYPIKLPFTGNGSGDVISVNDLADYTKFRQALTNAKKVVIMGVGLIGCEFANDLQQGGFEITIIDPASHPLGQLVPKQVGQTIQQALQDLGIRFHFGKTVKNIDKGYKITLSDNSILQADVVLSAVGLIPHTKLATDLTINRGIVVDR
ncbi:FAD-dependent oxidoreductase, partial [Thiotrichales bacterium HSG1]|nr:FAD-dependent oxidoreductase [Thiotrichales bacterium HSG1]